MQTKFITKRVYGVVGIWLLAGAMAVMGCKENTGNDDNDSDDNITDSERDSMAGTDTTAGTDVVPLDTELTGGCTNLFGLPRENTGIGSDACNTTCTCGGETFAAPAYSDAFIERLAATETSTPFDEVTADPYETPDDFPYLAGKVCAVQFDGADDTRYALETFDSADDAVAAGGIVTHEGQCGRCSTLYNLSVYLQYDDMTDVVRGCALANLNSPAEDNIQCLVDLGFDLPCAQIWHYNSKHTRELCFEPCIAALGDAYHNPDGSLNTCLQCDEDDSGTVFKAVAGRTRRNSGLPSAICRPCDEVSKVMHAYWE